MSKKSKGINAERELVHQFWEQGWACVRVSGSGSMQLPLPDLLVGNSARRLAIECKTTKGTSKYFTSEEIANLVKFADMFGAEAWLAVKFNRKGWRFFRVSDIKKTGLMHSVSLEMPENLALPFQSLISVK